jgi:hypothetical protein
MTVLTVALEANRPFTIPAVLAATYIPQRKPNNEDYHRVQKHHESG